MSSTTQLQVTSWQQIADHFPGVQTLADLEDAGLIQFRNYQALAALSVVFSGFRGVVRAATGSGKTLIASAICGAMLPKKTVVMIHGRELVAQTYREFCKFLGKKNVGVISSETFDPKAVTIASIDTFSFYMGDLPVKKKTGVPIMDPNKFKSLQKKFTDYLDKQVDMLVFDEVHHGSADIWQDVGKHTNAFYRVGLSGTPLKHDDLSDMLMLSLVGPVVYDLNAPWLQEQGYLAQADLLIKKLDYTSPATRGLIWQQARKQLLVQNDARASYIAGDIVEAIQEKNTRLLVLTGNSVELAEKIAEEVEALSRPLTRKLGFKPYTMITGKMSAKKVSRAFNDLRKGNVRCVITTKLADEGIDVPDINLLYLVGGGKAYVSAVQRVGRGLRVKEDGAGLLVVDYFTLGNKYVEKHDRQRLKTYEKEDFFREINFIDVT
jgi:superfamily II DNA or RNA helicase